MGTSAFAVKNNAIRRRRTPWKRNTASRAAAVALQGDAGDPNEFGDRRSMTLFAAFSSRVEVRIDEESEAVYPARFGSRVRLHLRSEVKRRSTLDPHGTAADPCGDEEITAKFMRLAALSNSGVNACALVETVSRLDTVPTVETLTACVRH